MMIERIENLIISLINSFLSQGFKAEISFNDNKFTQIETSFEKRDSKQRGYSLQKLYNWHFCNRQRFVSFLYVLAEVHELFVSRNHCTFRQLYYRNIDFVRNLIQIQAAVNDVCDVLCTTSWDLGIFAAGKCFISGPLVVHMSNGDIINCNEFGGPTLMPPNFTYIDKFETSAKIALVVEKNTVFQNLIACGIFSMLNGNIILITARGYPDVCTRWILHKLWAENFVRIYSLVDGDPFGIEIMIVYRYGSPRLNAFYLMCPEMKWLGIHPSEINHMTIPKERLSTSDRNKIKSLLSRSYLDDEIRTELLLLEKLRYKVKIDNVSPNQFSPFIIDYIIIKIKRQIVL